MLTMFNFSNMHPIPPQTRISTSSGQGKTLSDITHIRRRKSTSAKAAKTRSALFGPPHLSLDPSGSGHASIDSARLSAKSATKLTHTTSSRPSLPPLTTSPTFTNQDRPLTTPQEDRFSTADRTIQQGLKEKREAKEAEFVKKGEGSSLVPALGFGGKRHHKFPKEEVPYPRSYEREVIDLLDLGCGTGTWILNCAMAWTECHFIGLDIVPLQPDPTSNLASRITWVHHNFLEGLPFPDDEFDFVHIKRIALGVPEDKWDRLFEEICRVMKPGGAFEMLEEDLFFPGIPSDDDDAYIDLERRPSSVISSQRQSTQSLSDTNLESLTDSEPSSFRSNGTSPPTPTTAAFPATPSRSISPTAEIAINDDIEKEEAQELLAQVIGDSIIPSEEILDGTLSPATIRGHPQATTLKSALGPSDVSLVLSSVGSAASHPVDTTSEPRIRTRSRGLSLTASLSIPDVKLRGQSSLSPSPVPEVPPSVPPVPLLLRTIPKPPANPRDHSLLEAIYTRLLEARFINSSPLALLANYVGFYLKDVRTHPPLQYHFPAVPRRVPPKHAREANGDDTDSTSDSDDARDAIVPSPITRTVKRRHSQRNSTQNHEEEDIPISEDNQYVGVRSLIHHSSPYISIDESRASALSPSIKGTFPNTPRSRLQRGYVLPNTTMHLDVKTLNLHLALRAAEIVACSETMWEWVLEYKHRDAKERETANIIAVRAHRSGSGSIEMPSRRSIVSPSTKGDSSDPFEGAILDLTREDFDGLVNKFEMDMRDKCAVGDRLGDRLSWRIQTPSVSQQREVFETACEKWDKWEQEQRLARSSSRSSRGQHRQHSPSGPSTHSQHSLLTLEGSHASGRPMSDEMKKMISSNSSVTLPPARRISRAMRVFVAWKAIDSF
ncbi:hypothetical protein DXG01_013042 [Tephrocybe rancida]|nr:hypothetical protein DXG01_013042 [Tephrocybe rancida]